MSTFGKIVIWSTIAIVSAVLILTEGIEYIWTICILAPFGYLVSKKRAKN